MGVPSMRLFKANPPAQSEEDRARDLRLTSIASRYRTRSNIVSELELAPRLEPQPEPGQ